MLKVDSIFKEDNLLKTKDELYEDLNDYKTILSNQMYIYLKQLIDLDFSVLKNYINEKDRKNLSELNIYKKIMIYNIYKRALNILNERKDDIQINTNAGLSAYAKLKDRNVQLFDLSYKSYHFKNINSPSLSLYKTDECSDELKEKELDRINKILIELYKEKNPYHSEKDICGGPDSWWNIEHSKKVKEFEELKENLENRSLSDEDKKEIELTNYFYNKLFLDYGLSLNNFEENNSHNKTLLEKNLVKKMPKLIILNNNKYI